MIAAYAMDTVTLGRARLDFGLRAERTNADYTGHVVLTDEFGHYVATTPTSGGSNYTNLLPRLNLVIEIDPRTNFRAAAGRGLARPNFADLPPFFVENDRKDTIDAGNPNLKPTRSDSYDLMLERYFNSIGFASVGFFYKALRDPIYPGVESDIVSGPSRALRNRNRSMGRRPTSRVSPPGNSVRPSCPECSRVSECWPTTPTRARGPKFRSR